MDAATASTSVRRGRYLGHNVIVSKEKPQALDDQLCFALYAASRAVTATYRPILDELGLTYPQYLVLLVLWERGAMPMKDIGSALHLDYGTLSPLLKRLEASGLIRRERRPDDERSVMVTTTDRGEALQARAAALPISLGKSLTMSVRDIERLRRELRDLTQQLTR